MSILKHEDQFKYMPGKMIKKKIFDWDYRVWTTRWVFDLGAKRILDIAENPDQHLVEKYPGLSGQALQIASFISENGPSTSNEIFLSTGIKASSSIKAMQKNDGFEISGYRINTNPGS